MAISGGMPRGDAKFSRRENFALKNRSLFLPPCKQKQKSVPARDFSSPAQHPARNGIVSKK
jgi:hypothetical protein